MAKGGSSSTTTVSPTTVSTDQSANAGGAGSFAVGSGAKVMITDAGIAKAALEAATTATGQSLAASQNVSGMALAANENVSLKAIDTTAGLAQSAVNTTLGLAQISAAERQDVLSTTNTALQSQQGSLNQLAQLASSALERSQTPDSQTTKTLLYVAGAVAIAFALVAFAAFRRSPRK